MKKMIKSLKSIAILSLILVISISCDNDFTNIESNIQGVKNFEATSKLFPFTAKTQNFTPFSGGLNDEKGVQTNNLNGKVFGVYKNPTNGFGTTVASVISQVAPLTYNPDFGNIDRTIESVWLNIPYYSTLESTDTDGNNTYTLDSIYGDTDQEFKLYIYRSNYVLRDLDPSSDFETTQSYFSNQGDLFESVSTAADLIYTDENFKISASEHTISEIIDGEEVIERITPGIRLNLLYAGPNSSNDNVSFWESIFFDNQDSEILSTQSNFKDFFRGLIIKVVPVDETNPNGSLTYLNFDSGSIVFDYTNLEEENAEAAGETYDTTEYTLEFNGNIVNTFNQINAVDHDGDEDNLYLQGTDGSMAVIDLFSGDIENEDGDLVPSLDYFVSKNEKWLINEANLVFYVNKDLVEGDEPDRVTLYDLKNNAPIIDYFLDGTTNTAQPEFSKILFSETLERDSEDNGVKYKIRLTSHITNILQNDSTNVKLGLFLVNNINVTSESTIQGVNSDDDDTTLDMIPSTSILSPKGTILHGYSDNVDTPLRAEFEIFYTEPEN